MPLTSPKKMPSLRASDSCICGCSRGHSAVVFTKVMSVLSEN